jgi:hypothetical protein
MTLGKCNGAALLRLVAEFHGEESPKAEGRKPKEIRNPKRESDWLVSRERFGIRVSDFGFRRFHQIPATSLISPPSV